MAAAATPAAEARMGHGCWRSSRGAGLVLLAALLMLPTARGVGVPDDDLPKPPVRDFGDKSACAVVEVPAGNVVVVRLAGENLVLRLIGVFVPKSGAAEDEARLFLERLLLGEGVYVEHEADWPLRDREDRLWAYVYRAPDGLFANLELIRQGYARLSAADPFEHEKLFRSYEQYARCNHKGVWDPDARDSPGRLSSQPGRNAARTSASRPTAEAPASQPGELDDVLVYVTEHGAKYHRQGCAYARNGARPITVREAKQKGYTPCSRCRPPE